MNQPMPRTTLEEMECETRALRAAVIRLSQRDRAAARHLCEDLLKTIGYAPEKRQEKAYIVPRKRQPDETPRESLCRRLEEYIEFAHATRRFTEVGFFEALLDALEGGKKEEGQDGN